MTSYTSRARQLFKHSVRRVIGAKQKQTHHRSVSGKEDDFSPEENLEENLDDLNLEENLDDPNLEENLDDFYDESAWGSHQEYNLHLPIHQLPPELFSEILLFVLEPWIDTGPAEGYFEELLELQEVSSYWFQTIHHTPELWSYLHSGTGPRLSELFLHRSKEAPLYIWCPKRVKVDQEKKFLELVLPQIHRWYSFSSTSGSILPSAIEVFGTKRAPILERFSVFDFPPKLEHADEFEVGALFDDFAPRLQYLDIRSVIIPWSSGILSGLTDLSMTAREHGGFPDCPAFFAILSSCPSLERLVMSGGKKWKDACARSLQAEKQEIRLPRLKSLSLEYLHPVIIGTLLSSIIFIALPNFLLDVIANPSLWHTDPRLESILPPFDSNNIGVLPQNIQSLQWLDIDYLVGGGRLVAYGGKWNGTHPDTTMRIDMLEAEDPLPALLRTILLPDLAQFTSLTLNGTALFADDLIANHLRYLQRLERLHITDAKEDAVHGIFSALTPSRLSPQHQLLWPCPNLRKLRLHDALFQIERLLDMIEARQGREVRNMTWKGVPLEHLELGRNEIRNMNPNVVRQVEEIIIGQGVFEWPYRKWVTTNYV